jgi:hypothetical protein
VASFKFHELHSRATIPQHQLNRNLVDSDSQQKEFTEEISLPVLGNLKRIHSSSSQGYSQYPELDIRLSLYQIIIAWDVMILMGSRRGKNK